jgi:hypothetical protein
MKAIGIIFVLLALAIGVVLSLRIVPRRVARSSSPVAGRSQ